MNGSNESPRRPRIEAVMREGEERVTPLELFFDLVFVLALTQCTALMAEDPTWEGLIKGTLVLGVLWWAWVGYVWLASVINPEEGIVRLVFFAAMAGLLVAALCVPGAFDEYSLLFVCAYAVVRAMQIALFVLASRDDRELRRSTFGLAASSAVGVGILAVAALLDGEVALIIWGIALLLDMAGPFFFGSDGWKLSPNHFAERHGLVVTIALGESIVAIGIGSTVGIDVEVVLAAVLGVIVAATLWWAYFDVVAIAAERRLARAQEGTEQNEIARDSYSYLHLPMIAGIVLIALGLKKTVGHPDDPLHLVVTSSLFGGAALYLLAHIAFRLRNFHTLNKQRLACSGVLLLSVPFVSGLTALTSLAILAGVLTVLISYEAIRFAVARERLRHAS